MSKYDIKLLRAGESMNAANYGDALALYSEAMCQPGITGEQKRVAEVRARIAGGFIQRANNRHVLGLLSAGFLLGAMFTLFVLVALEQGL